MALELDKLLVKKADFANFRDIGVNTDDERIDPFIREAQTMELRSFLGDVLYAKMEDDFTPDSGEGTFATAKYSDLWFGVRWTRGGDELIHPGLKPAVVYWAYGRFLDNSSVFSMRSGLRKLTDDSTEDATSVLIRDKKTKARDSAMVFQSDADYFLRSNGSIYPEYGHARRRRSKQSSGFKFTVIK